MPMMVKKIGDIVSGLDFSIEEMDRIGILLLENKSLPSVILGVARTSPINVTGR